MDLLEEGLTLCPADLGIRCVGKLRAERVQRLERGLGVCAGVREFLAVQVQHALTGGGDGRPDCPPIQKEGVLVCEAAAVIPCLGFQCLGFAEKPECPWWEVINQAAGNLQVQDLEEIDVWLAERKTPEEIFAEEEAAEASGN